MKCPFGVVVIGKDRKIRWAKEAACTIAAVDDLATIVGRRCAEFLCPDEQCDCPVLDHGREVNNAVRILRRYDGSLIPILRNERRSLKMSRCRNGRLHHQTDQSQ